MRVPRTLAALVAAMTIGAAAAAQTAPPTSATREPFSGWSAQAGYETFALRDISRNIRPPDASPVSWRGAGPVVTGRYDRATPRSGHLAEVTVARARDFKYVSPTRSIAAVDADTASRVDVRYEYRRYLWRDAGIAGLDIGAGLQAVGTRLAFDRHATPSASASTRIAGGGLAGVVSLRLNRWDRVHLHASWANGAVVSRRTAEHSANALSAGTFSGGNWLTDIVAGGDWRLTPGMRLSAAWRRSYEGYSSSHYSYAGRRHSLTVGVVYER